MTPLACPPKLEGIPPVGRRVVRTGWRIAAAKLRDITDVEELMRRSRRLADLVCLTPRQHRKACNLVIEHGEDYLARWLTELDTVGPFDHLPLRDLRR